MPEIKKAKKASHEEVDSFLKGSNPMEHVIKVECGYNDSQATVIWRDDNFDKHYDKHPFYPFCWAKREAGQNMCHGDREQLKLLMQTFNIGCKGLITANEDGEVNERMANGYTLLFYAKKAMSNQEFTQFFDTADVPIKPKEKHWSYTKNYYKSCAPNEQFMISTGIRLFKGYESYDDIMRMQFDIETTGLDKANDLIDQIGIRTNKGFCKAIQVTGTTYDEKLENGRKAINEMFDIVDGLDPDVVAGYNSEGFDFEFFDVFLRKHFQVEMADETKRDTLPNGVFKKKQQSVLKLGGEMEYYYPTVMWGKHITDCLFSVRRAQALDSNMKKATLKYVTKYSKINKKNRVYVPGNIITETWNDKTLSYAFNDENGDWYKIDNDHALKDGYETVSGNYIVNRYLEDDLWETDKVELRYNESNFLVGKMLPVNFERMCTMGTATIWKYIMMAWSYEHDLAIPLEISARSFTGGLSRLLSVGYIPNVQKLDYNSLYPSIILTFDIKSPIDISGAMPAMLEYILTQREYYKGLKGKYGKEAKKVGKQLDELIASLKESDEYNRLSDQAFSKAINKRIDITELKKKQEDASALSTRNDKMQLPLKITGNAYFGSFGAGGGIFNWSDIDCAEETTCCGRQMLRLMLKWFTDLGYEGIVCDTDGMNFKQPPVFRYTEDNPYISTGMNRNTVKGEKYVGPWGDLAEFNDLFMRKKNGLDIDEFVPASVYLARKNYADLLDAEKQEIKLVGNTIKSKKMPIYIEKFVDSSIRDLLNDRGKDYIEKYYDKIDEIYNLRIPLKDIATVGKIKISLDEYKKACQEKTKSGTKKSRQAWYELAIKHNLDVHMGDSIYYINTGTKKNDSDVQRITHYYSSKLGSDGKYIDVTKDVKKEHNNLKKLAKENDANAKIKLGITDTNKKAMNLSDFVSKYYPEYKEEDELIFNCILLPREIVEDEDPHYCDDEFEYNVAKYINMFNNRVKAQFVCFDKKIRDHKTQNSKGETVIENNIIIDNPKDRKFFTEGECKLTSGQPYNETDQDTYEQLMTMEDKEIKFWMKVGKTPVYIQECGMDWDEIQRNYCERMEQLKQGATQEEYNKYMNIISHITADDIEKLETEGVIPESILKFCDYDYQTNSFISKEWEIKIGELWDILDKKYDTTENKMNGIIDNEYIKI